VILKCGAAKGCRRLVGTDRVRIKEKRNIQLTLLLLLLLLLLLSSSSSSIMHCSL
jgi:hypothetical protein